MAMRLCSFVLKFLKFLKTFYKKFLSGVRGKALQNASPASPASLASQKENNMDIEKLLKGEGGYIFISHSHLDIKTVREIRNFLEEKGLEPILFYLKSMDDGKTDRTELLTSLIHDEIDAREFFLYLNSDNARSSKWVQDELEYVKRTAPHKIIDLDLNDGVESLNNKMKELTRRLRIYLSHSHHDTVLANKIKNELVARDFRVYMDDGLSVGSNWATEIAQQIADAGCLLYLMTEKSINSETVFREISYAYSMKSIIIPIIVGKVLFPPRLMDIIGRMQCFLLDEDCTDGQIKELVANIRSSLTI